MTKNKELVIDLFQGISRPLSRIAMRFGASAREVADITRWSFVKTFYSSPDLWRKDQPTAMQCSLKTGLTRVESKRLSEMNAALEAVKPNRQSRSPRVIEGWLNDPEYSPNGKPASLPFRSAKQPCFYKLCGRYSGDNVHAESILEDLLEAKCVEVNDKIVSLTDPVYGIKHVDSKRIEIIGFMVEQLMETSDYNLDPSNENHRRFQRYWRQRLLPVEKVDEARQMVTEITIEAGRKIDALLNELSHANPVPNTKYCDIGLGAYIFENEAEISAVNINSNKEPGE
ncbi:MAG: hypothetical protein KY410_08065 [Proteobacteria bacterium]|nr:hypothetical protein [Pseudomonadota bacterium]